MPKMAEIHIQKTAPGAANDNGAGDACDIAGADRGGQRGGERLQRCDLALACLLLLEDLAEGVAHGIAELTELQEAGADGEDDAYADQKTEHDRAPRDVIQPGDKLAECHRLFLLRFSLNYLMRYVQTERKRASPHGEARIKQRQTHPYGLLPCPFA